MTGLNLRLGGVSSLRHSLTFTSASGNWSSAQTLTLVAVNDDYDEGAFGKDNQSFRVQIDNVTSADPKYNLDNVSISGSVDNGSNFTNGQDNFTIAVLDNDQTGVVVSALDNQSAERGDNGTCLLYTSPSPRDRTRSRMPSSA